MSFIPLEVVAGRLSVDGANDHEAVMIQRAAHQGLSTQLQKYVAARQGGFIYYLAAAAADFASLEFTPTVPLACALPGHRDFKGPGLYYCLNVSGMYTYVKVLPDLEIPGAYVVTVDKDSEESIRAEAFAASDELNEELVKRGATPFGDLPTYRVTETESNTLWQSAEHLMLTETRKTFRRTIAYTALAALVFGAIAVGASVMQARANPLVESGRERAQAQLLDAAAQVTAIVNKGQPKAAEEFDSLVRIAEDQNGYIVAFNATTRGTEWELVVPMSADYEAWKRLGPFNSFERDGMRVIQKKAKK